MPLIGTYSGGSASANSYDTFPELLSQLPDNTANLIVASDIRDAVFSLWTKIDNVEIIASQSASASSYYTNSNIVPADIGGISAGMSFSGTYSIQQMFDMLLYPYILPVSILSGGGNRQYGAPLSVVLNWSVVRNTNIISSVVVDGVIQSFTGNTEGPNIASGTHIGTHSVTPGSSQTNSFTMSVSDGINTVISSTSLVWMNRRYWGKVDLSSIGNPNLTLNPGSASFVGVYITDNIIKSLSGANANSQLFGYELSTTKSKTYNGIDGSGQYLIFAWPSNVAGPTAPSFTVNGLSSTAFTRVRTNSGFSNEYGFTGVNYEVWVSNTLQNSPLNIIIS
jgi:hypothetical protein